MDNVMVCGGQASEEDKSFYKEILNTLDTGIILYDADGWMKHANTKACHILPQLKGGLSKYSQLISFIYDHSLAYDDQSQLSFAPAHRAESVAFNEVICINQDTYYAVHMTYKDSDTTKDLIVELFDVSQIKQGVDDIHSLDKDKRLLTKAIRTSEKGIFIAENRDRRHIIFANEAMDIFFKNENLQWIGRSVEDILSIGFSQEWPNIKKVLDQSGQEYFWCRRESGNSQNQWLRLNLFVENPKNHESLIIGFISDETKNKMQENQLIQNQKLEAIGKLAGGIAHDFNNILSIVDGYMRLSEGALRRGEAITENLARIKQAVARGSSLTKQLLTFGKHRVKENEYIDVCEEIREIEVLLKPLLGAGINLRIETISAPCIIRSNTDSMTQIIINLSINARDAMPDGGEIIIRIKPLQKNNRSYVSLEVKDTGSGIHPDIISKIFDPFFTTKGQGKGTGLGLSMVYGIVQQLDATIDVTSVIGEGTIFTIEIPMAEDIRFKELKNREIENPLSLKGKTILVAEDEEDLLTIMEMTLKEYDMKVLRAKNGNEALVIQDEYDGKIDFLLTDMVMPELGGLKLAELVREVRPDTNILFMSGYPVRGEISNVDLPKDSIFMAKPIAPEILLDYLVQTLAGQPIYTAHVQLWEN